MDAIDWKVCVMEKRICERIPVSIEIEYYLWNPLFWKKLYTGTIKNISEKGMFISGKTINFPLDALLEISIPVNKDVVHLPAINSNIVWKRMLSDDSCDSIGVELSNPPDDYLKMVESLKTDSVKQYQTTKWETRSRD